MTNNRLPRIVITPGEPAGIGPDLCVLLAQSSYSAQLIACADLDLLKERSQALQIPLNCVPWDSKRKNSLLPGEIFVHHVPLNEAAIPGKLNVANANYVLETLRVAVNGCLSKDFDALVTGPVQKSIINDAGIAFTGHTEFLAEITQASMPVMMLATEGLRVALVTTHLPVSLVAQNITAARLEEVIRVLHRDLQMQFGIASPNILVCGLNPHAGENGHLGREEIEIIEPVLNKLRNEGMRLRGPLPADTLFTPKNLQHTDAVLAMYHDQGLPVLKYVGFGNAINITLGLPIVRTSVDHGTALELAGTRHADVSSFQLAVKTAIEISTRIQNETSSS